MIIPFDGTTCGQHSSSGVCGEIALEEVMMIRLNFDQINSVVKNFEESHPGYAVRWHTIEGVLGINSICFRVISKPQYRLRVDDTGDDGVPSMSMNPDEMCISIAKAVSARTIFLFRSGPEFIIRRTLEQMVGKLEKYRKCGLTGNWILPDE